MSANNSQSTITASRSAGWVALTASILTVGLITYGAWVRASGSGLGCPDWPLCYGTVAPELSRPTWIEWGHRLFAGLVMITVAAGTLIAFMQRRADPGAFKLMGITLAVILSQAVLGGITVLTELKALIVMAHLALALTTLTLLTVASIRILQPRLGTAATMPSTRTATLLLASGAVVVILGSSLIATNVWAACSRFPLCDPSTPANATVLHMLHRIIAALLWIALLVTAIRLTRMKAAPLVKMIAHGTVTAYFLQGLIGIGGAQMGFAEYMRVLHLGFAALVWWGLSAFWYASFRVHSPRVESR